MEPSRGPRGNKNDSVMSCRYLLITYCVLPGLQQHYFTSILAVGVYYCLHYKGQETDTEQLSERTFTWDIPAWGLKWNRVI